MVAINNSKSSGKNAKPHDTDATSADKSKNVSHVPCKFFLQSACQAGDKCPFSHKIDTSIPPICKYFQKGTCKFGNKCALAHITPDGKHVNKKTKEKKKEKQKSKSQTSAVPLPAQTTSAPEDYHFADAHNAYEENPHSPATIDTANQMLSKFNPNLGRLTTPRGSFSTTLVSNSSFNGLSPAWSGLAKHQEESAIADDDEYDEDDEGYTEQLLPSSLEDLLTPTERLRRNSRNSVSRPFQRSSMPLNAPEGIQAFKNRHNSHSYFNEHDNIGSPPTKDLWTSRPNHRPAFLPFQSDNSFHVGTLRSSKSRPNLISEPSSIPDMYSGGSIFMSTRETTSPISPTSPIGSPIGHSNTFSAMIPNKNSLANY